MASTKKKWKNICLGCSRPEDALSMAVEPEPCTSSFVENEVQSLKETETKQSTIASQCSSLDPIHVQFVSLQEENAMLVAQLEEQRERNRKLEHQLFDVHQFMLTSPGEQILCLEQQLAECRLQLVQMTAELDEKDMQIKKLRTSNPMTPRTSNSSTHMQRVDPDVYPSFDICEDVGLPVTPRLEGNEQKPQFPGYSECPQTPRKDYDDVTPLTPKSHPKASPLRAIQRRILGHSSTRLHYSTS